MRKEYGSQRLKVRRPPIIVNGARVVGGLLILLLVFLSIPYNYNFLVDLFDRLVSTLEHASSSIDEITGAAYIAAMVAFACFFLPAIIRAAISGLKFVFGGLSEIVRPWMPANVPVKFRDYQEVARGFKDRALTIYKSLDAFTSGILGKNTMFLSPVQREVVEDNAKRLKRRLLWFLISVGVLALVLWFVNWLTTGSAGNLLQETDARTFNLLIAEGARKTLRTPFLWLVVLQVVLGAVEFVSSTMLVPHGQPSTVADEGSEYYRGFGHPTQLFNRLPDLGTSLTWQGFPNRAYSSWDERALASVGDTGTFQGYLIIEQQPQPIGTPSVAAGYLLLGAGWLLTLAGYGIFLFQLLPEPIRRWGTTTADPFLYAPIFVLAMGATAWIATRSGTYFNRQARKLFEATRFRSPAILIECAGNLSRADVRVGKSMADSIESSSIVVRSDFTARFWAAELISEAARLDEPRELLALNATPESQKWVDLFEREIYKLRAEGVQPLKVELATEEVSQIVDANVAISAGREAATKRAQLQSASEESAPPAFPGQAQAQLESGEPPDPSVPIPDGWKECPDCAEIVRARARKCRFCGYRFDQD